MPHFAKQTGLPSVRMTGYNTVKYTKKKKPKELYLVQSVAKPLLLRCTSCFADLSFSSWICFLYSLGLFPHYTKPWESPLKATLSCTVFKTHREIVRQIARRNAHTYRTPNMNTMCCTTFPTCAAFDYRPWRLLSAWLAPKLIWGRN